MSYQCPTCGEWRSCWSAQALNPRAMPTFQADDRHRIEVLTEALRAVATALPVLRSLCEADGLTAGAKKADEMAAWCADALTPNAMLAPNDQRQARRVSGVALDADVGRDGEIDV